MRKKSTPAQEPPDGLRYLPEFISLEEEERLVEKIATLSFEKIEMRGVVAKREALHYGWNYRYDEWKIDPTEEVPPFLHSLRERVAFEMNVSPNALEEVLLTRYPPGAGIGWHRDAPMFGAAVGGISLRSGCIMKFRRTARDGYEVWHQRLDPRSLYIIGGTARSAWQHTIASLDEERYSITFRTLRRARERAKTA